MKNIKIFTSQNSRYLAEDICKELNIELGKSESKKFSDGEIYVKINEPVRGEQVFIIGSTNYPVNDNLMELLITIDALKRASAEKIAVVIPYYGYARQDRKASSREPITAKLVADLLEVAGADRVLTMDLHAPQIQGFFNIPVDHLVGQGILSKYYIEKGFGDRDDVVVVSPDLGSVTRTRKFAEMLNLPMAIIDKRRQKANFCEVMNVIGEIKNKTCIMVDDMIDTAGTITNGATSLMEMGAKDVYCCCTHAVLSGGASEKLNLSPIKELVMLDTIKLPETKMIDKIKVLSVAAIFAETIKRVNEHVSISNLFDN